MLETLRALHEVFAVELGVCLSEYLRAGVQVRLSSVERVECSRFEESPSGPLAAVLLSSPPLEGRLVFWIEPSILRPMIERLLGEEPAPEGTLPAREREAARSILIILLERLSAAWEVLGPIRFEYQEVEQASSPEVPRGEPAFILDFEVRMGERLGAFHLLIPDACLSPFGAEDLEVAAVLAEPPVRLGDLLLLRPGDIIETGKPAGECLILEVNQKPRFLAQAEPSRGKLAFRITKKLPR